MNSGYRMSGNQKIYSIYSSLQKLLPNSRIIDLTIPKLGIFVPSPQEFEADLSIMNFAYRVITLGSGGNFSLALLTKNNISYRQDRFDFCRSFYSHCFSKEQLLTFDTKIFLNQISKL